MKRLVIIAEGCTEEAFVKQMLVPHFSPLEIYISCGMLSPGKEASRAQKGGWGRTKREYARIKNQLETWMKQDPAAYFTTMLDYYGLPTDFPGTTATRSHLPGNSNVLTIENAFAQDIGSPQFVPYIQLYEFEALLFSDPDAFRAADPSISPQQIEGLKKILAAFHHNPEEINDSWQTCPSRRIEELIPRYAKNVDGPQIAEEIGLDSLRRHCAHFNAWIQQLETL